MPDKIKNLLHKNSIPTKGEEKRATKSGCTITIGLTWEDDRIKAGQLMSNKIIDIINVGKPLRLGVVWPLPKRACIQCYSPLNSDNLYYRIGKRSQ